MVHICNGILLSHKKEMLPFAITWMNLEDINEASQTEDEKYCKISLTGGIFKEKKIVAFIEAQSRMLVTRSWGGGGNGEILVKRYKVAAT